MSGPGDSNRDGVDMIARGGRVVLAGVFLSSIKHWTRGLSLSRNKTGDPCVVDSCLQRAHNDLFSLSTISKSPYWLIHRRYDYSTTRLRGWSGQSETLQGSSIITFCTFCVPSPLSVLRGKLTCGCLLCCSVERPLLGRCMAVTMMQRNPEAIKGHLIEDALA